MNDGVPEWLRNALDATYGGYLSRSDPEYASSYDKLESNLVVPVWFNLLKRLGVSKRPPPQLVLVDSPAAKPMTFVRGAESFYVYDLHLLGIMHNLTYVAHIDLSPDQITTVAWAICAERCFAAGKPEAAARLAAYANAQKWTLPVAQLEPDAARVGSWTRYFQHSFMVAHELCHLAFRIDEQQKRAAISEHSGEIRKVLDDGTVLKSKSTGPIELSERLRSMEARGYRVTDSARKLAEYPGLFPEPKPWVITKVGIWDSVRDNEAFLEECAADAWALFTLFDVSRPRKEPIQAWGALVALLNLGVIQRLDGIAAGSALRSVREDPHDDVWAARIRVMALKNWATAMIVQHKGEAEARRYLEMYKYSSERYHVTLDDTLDLGMDLNEMLRLRRSNPEEADAVEHWTRSITSLRTLLGFPLANRRSSVHWYINYAIGEPSSAPDATTPWPVQIDAMPES